MKKLKTGILFVVTLSLIFVAVYALYRFFYFLVSGVLSLDTGVVAAIIASAATVLVSVFSLIYNQRQTKEREIAESHRPKKIKLYKRFMDEAIVGALRLAEKEDGKSIYDKELQQHLKNFFLQFTADLIAWGSPQVIRAYKEYRKSPNSPYILFKVDDMLRAIRQDLGHSNRGIHSGDLIKLFLSDPDKLKESVNIPANNSKDKTE